jgi:two-component system cell cycle sensor histidine kinase/response regulator CckA
MIEYFPLLYYNLLMRWERFFKPGFLFAAPVFADPVKTLAAARIFSIVRAFILSSTFLQLVQIAIAPKITLRWLTLLLATVVVSLILLELTRRGHVRSSEFLLVLSLWLLISIFSWTASGLGTRAAYGYFIVVFIASMVLGKWPGIITAVICSVATLGIALAGPVRSNDPYRFWLVNSLYLVIVLLLQELAERSIRESLSEAKQQLHERQQAEDALRARENLLSSIFRAAPTGIGVVSNRILTEVNDRICAMTGWTQEELIGKSSRRLYPSDADFDYVGKEKYRQIAERGTGTVETRWQCQDGRIIDVLMSSTPIDPSELSAGVTFTALDITDRKKAEKALRESEEKYRQTMNVAPIGIYIIQDLLFKFVNPEMARLHGYDSEEMVEKMSPPDELVAPEHRELVRQTLLRRQANVRGEPYEIKAVRKDGSLFDALVWGQGISYDGRPASIGTLLDISERKRAETALKESEYRYRMLFEASSDSIFVMKEDLFFDCNSKTLEMFHCTRAQILGKTTALFSPPLQPDGSDSRAQAREKIHAAYAGQPQFFEWTHLKANGATFVAEVSLTRIDLAADALLLAMVRDISERKALEEQLLQAQKMEAIGILAGGVAHDFNNILSTIVGYSSLLQMKLQEEGPFKGYIERILTATERAANLTNSLLAFSRKQEIELQSLDINDAINGFHKILERMIGEDIDFSLNLTSQSLVVDADVRQIEQVLMNLANNSRDAMPRGGKLTIHTAAAVLDEAMGEIPTGSYAVVTVVDNGPGISQDIQSHIFEPFFTTKEVGKGTGLGLAIVYGIIRKHQGFIHVDSTPGQGTTFRIYLPLNTQVVKKTTHRKQDKIPTGSETILLIEDDSAVRQVTRSLLEEFGYTVLEAANGVEGRDLFRQQQDNIQLILCDLIMPLLNGRETLAEIKKMRPAVKAIFMSGYTANIIAGEGITDPGMPLLLKPVNPASLLKEIRSILDG